MIMRLEQAIVYVLATAGYGMTTQAIADAINEEGLYILNNGQPVSDKFVYATICRYADIVAREGGLIYLIM